MVTSIAGVWRRLQAPTCRNPNWKTGPFCLKGDALTESSLLLLFPLRRRKKKKCQNHPGRAVLIQTPYQHSSYQWAQEKGSLTENLQLCGFSPTKRFSASKELCKTLPLFLCRVHFFFFLTPKWTNFIFTLKASW